MRTLLWGVVWALGCAPDLGDECATDADCRALGAGLHCFDRLCVLDPPDLDAAVVDAAFPPGAPQIVGCGAVEAGDLEVSVLGTDRWRLAGRTGETRVVESSCGGRGADGAFALRFDQAGLYTLVSDPTTAFQPVLTVRDGCVSAGELTCDRAGFDAPALVIVEVLEPDAPPMLFVDGEDAGGDFTLTALRADRLEAPTPDAAILWRGAEQGVVRVAGGDPNGDADALELTWLDADGTPVGAPQTHSLRPAPLGEQAFSVQIEVGVAPEGAAGATIRLGDRQGAWSAPIAVEVRALSVLEGGAACDPASAAERCAAGLICPAVQAPTCRAPGAPTLEHRASLQAPDAVFALTLADPDRDLVAIAWQPLTAGGEPLAERAPLPLFERWRGEAAQAVHARVMTPEGARRYRLWIEDAAGLEAAVEGVLDQPQQGRFGDACDPLGLTAQCEPGTWCRPSRDAHTCWPADAPTVVTLDAWYNGRVGSFGVQVEARDAEGLVGIAVGDATLRFHRVERTGTRAFGWGAWRVGEVPATVRLRNALGQVTAPIPISVLAPPAAPPGGGCDPLEALAVCTPPSRCLDTAGDRRFHCQ